MITEDERKQIRYEINWLLGQIEVLALRVNEKPRVQRQIDTYRNQIKQKEYQIALGR